MQPSGTVSTTKNNMRYQEEDLLINFNNRDVIQSAYKVNSISNDIVIIENVAREEDPDTYTIPKRFLDIVMDAGVFDVYKLR